MPQAAAIYARIPSVPDGSRLGVDRQVEDCKALAGSLGWPVVEVYVDNDVLAYSGRRHPAEDPVVDGRTAYPARTRLRNARASRAVRNRTTSG